MRTSLSQRLPDIFEQEHQLKRIYRGWVEVEIFIKLTGSVVDRVDHYSPDPHNVRGLFDSLERIEQKSLSKTFSLFAYINRKASEEHDSDRMIRQTLGDSLRTFMLMNRSRRESVITRRGSRDRLCSFLRSPLAGLARPTFAAKW